MMPAQAPPPMMLAQQAPPPPTSQTDKMLVTLPPGVVSGQQLQVQVSGLPLGCESSR
jgi:hypothetical protein